MLILTKEQKIQEKLKRVMKEARHWNERIQNIIKGYRDDELEAQLVKCIKDIDFDKMRDEEKEIILSKEFQLTGQDGRVLSRKLREFIDRESAQ